VTRQRLLFVSPRFLFPLDEGGKIRTVGILRAMRGGAFDVCLVSPGARDGGTYEADLASVCTRFRAWDRPPSGRAARALAALGPTPVAVATDRSVAGTRLIAEELARKPDVVVFDFAHAGILMPETIAVPSVMFTHNIETEILERHAKVAKGPWTWIWRREAAKMRAFEDRILRRFDTVIAVSQRDAAGLASQFGLPRVRLIDTGVDLDFYQFHPPETQTDTVVFSGSMDSRSNIDGIQFLMDEIWPLVAARRPGVRMIVAGRNPPAGLVERARQQRLNWHFTGFVEDIRPWLLEASVSIIPLRVGSGTRLKAFESMALGRPVVSTSLGVEGLPVIPDKHLLVADTAEAFGDAVLALLDDPIRRLQVAEAARQLLEGQFSWGHIARQFEQLCVETIQRA
jgi:glycosyltransferase involved in cell wall biosynthesis